MVVNKRFYLFFIMSASHAGEAFDIARIKLGLFGHESFDRKSKPEIDICKVEALALVLIDAFFDVRWN